MTAPERDITATLFVLPPDAKFVPVADLSARLRARIGPVEDGQSVITRPGFRVTTRMVPGPLAELIGEFRAPTRLTDGVLNFARAHDQDPLAMLDLSFDALATLVEARLLVPFDSPDAAAPAPSLAAGQQFADGFEIEGLVRSLEDSEVYRARTRDGSSVALKIARDDRPAIGAMFANEARMLHHLGGVDTPALLEHGVERGRPFLAMEWCAGVSIGIAAQQARAARDRQRLHDLVGRMLDAYARIHDRSVLHGDVHPGNCLVQDDGRVVILDFGNARTMDSSVHAVDLARAGIPQFYDPQMAAALLAGGLPPAATPVAEQYAIAVLAYVLVTGLHPIESPAVQDELLRRIVDRPPLPFAARGVAAWPEVEAVLSRGLATAPAERFGDVAGFSRAFGSAGVPRELARRWPEPAQRAFEAAVEAARSCTPCADVPESVHAWFALRAALALEDAELLAAADVLSSRAGPGWVAQSIAAHVARARSDSQAERTAIAGFLAAAESLRDGPELAAAIAAAAGVLDGDVQRSEDAARFGGWAAQRLDRLLRAPLTVDEPLVVLAALALCKSGALATLPDLNGRLDPLAQAHAGSVWLWALAHDVFADPRFATLALAAKLPDSPLWRGFALLRLHQVTGDPRWVTEATRVIAQPMAEWQIALLVAELMAPERVLLPPFARDGQKA